ncbi:uncharacterized protein G2W53_022698 [Senna tora]|uniref:Late embryogenesis abundant protein LEA-2 subgroup domain-containing protein n=1 Tax=Senna tora TaxID=362788 RepID=A0A834WPD7_9FABA|nr:uncharacterized protein G2W53_022698 [Senna tora]
MKMRTENETKLSCHHTLTYPCAYYVQSPSATTLTTPNDAASSTFHSPTRPACDPTHADALYRYSSSSRGSTHSPLFHHHHHKKISYDDGSHVTADRDADADVNRLIVVEEYDDDDDDVADYEWRRRKGWRRYCTYRNTDPCGWIWVQISWRVLVSLGVALLVFYVATKPPSPNFSLEIARIHEFKLGEGVDRTGVTTKILTCNCSIYLEILNKSKFFGLHIRPPIIDMSFGILPFAFSHGPQLYAESGTTTYALEVGTKNKVMYGAGRNMQDMLDSGRGLPILITMRLSSSFKMIPNLINPKFHHQLQCIVLLHKAYDKKHRTQAFNSTCKLTS